MATGVPRESEAQISACVTDLILPLSRRASIASTAARPRALSSSGASRAIGRAPRAMTNSSPRSTLASSSDRCAFASATFTTAATEVSRLHSAPERGDDLDKAGGVVGQPHDQGEIPADGPAVEPPAETFSGDGDLSKARFKKARTAAGRLRPKTDHRRRIFRACKKFDAASRSRTAIWRPPNFTNPNPKEASLGELWVDGDDTFRELPMIPSRDIPANMVEHLGHSLDPV